MRAWLLGLFKGNGGKGVNVLLRRWLLTILFVVLLGIPAFGWVQYRQTQNLERLTDQSFSNFEWDAFKLELRIMYLRKALHEVLMHPRSPQQLAQASKEYNLLAGQVLLIDKGRSRESMEDHPEFKRVMAQSLEFLRLAEPVLEDVHLDPDVRAMQVLFEHADNLQGNVHRLVIAAHDMRALRSVEMIKEVQSINYSFAFLSAVVVMLGAGWGVSAMRNLTLSSQRQQELNDLYLKSSFSASHDFLTGLANRRQLYDQLRHAIASSRRTGLYGAVILLDLDNFKPVNDTYGHDAGDMVLVEVASRMKKCVRDVDTVARVGGDEFVVLLGQVDGAKDHAREAADQISKKLLEALSEPYPLIQLSKTSQPNRIHHACSASLGICLFFKDMLTVDQIIQAADAAMYRAKQKGGNRAEMAG